MTSFRPHRPEAPPPPPLINYRVTIERADGTSYVRDEMAATPREAVRATLTAYRTKYSAEPVDGFTHWVRKCVEIPR